MAQYTITNSFSVSATNQYVAPDQFSATPGTNINYSSISIASNPNNTGLPNGKYGPLVGTLAGKASPGYTANVTTAFTYDAVNGLELIGDYTESSAGSHTASVQGVNNAGQVIGYEGRDDPNSTSTGSTTSVLGEETWLSTPTGPGTASSEFLGLFGTNNTYTATTNSSFGTTGTYSLQSAQYISSAGDVGGFSGRYEGNGGAAPNFQLGDSAWVFVPTTANGVSGTTSEVGLMGDGNIAVASYLNSSGGAITSNYYYNQVSGVNASGEVAGTSKEYAGKTYTLSTNAAPTALSSTGFDAWVQPAGASTATRIGGFTFTSSSISTYSATSITASNNGTVYTQTIPSPSITGAGNTTFTGTFAYGYIPTASTIPLGSTYATQVARNNNVYAINSSGLVGLTSSYYINNAQSASGQDAFVYNPTTATYTQVGLTTDSYAANATSTGGLDSFVGVNGGRSSSITFLNTNNQSAGTSAVYIPGYTSSAFGQAAWYANSSGKTTQIGLYNSADGNHYNTNSSVYEYGLYSDYVTAMNDKGMVAGYSYRQNSVSGSTNGQDAWVYDPSAGPNGTTFAVYPAAEANSPTGPYLSETIDYLSPSGVALGEYQSPSVNQAFVWSESSGFELLDTNITGGLSSSSYQNIINAYYSDTGGDTILATASGTYSNTVGGLVTLTGAVPEPSSLSLLAVGVVGLLRRRRQMTS